MITVLAAIGVSTIFLIALLCSFFILEWLQIQYYKITDVHGIKLKNEVLKRENESLQRVLDCRESQIKELQTGTV